MVYKYGTVATNQDNGQAMGEARKRVPKVIRVLMDHYGVSGARLGEALGVAPQAVYARLAGTTSIKAEELAELAKVFSVPVEVFFLMPADALRYVLDNGPQPPMYGMTENNMMDIREGYGDPQHFPERAPAFVPSYQDSST